MRRYLRVGFLLVALFTSVNHVQAQAATDSATAQIRGTQFAPSLNIDLARSWQTWSGTFVRELVPGHGAPQGKLRTVRVQLRMWLADGSRISDSAHGPTDTVTFVIGRGALIRGLEEGVDGMRVGGVRQLVIPSSAAFGRLGRDGVPPNAVLVAEVMMKDGAL